MADVTELERLERILLDHQTENLFVSSMYVETEGLSNVLRENIRLRAKVTELQETGTKLLNMLRDKKL